MTHIHIDGSQGEGGGQVLRSSLALSLVTGRPLTIDHIRANRAKPGLMRQHLTAVRAAAKVCGCDVDGAKIGSVRLDFRPEKIAGGHYEFNVGTAGSVTLVLQTVLPALILADKPSTLVLKGGTHNPMAPPFDFLKQVFLPQVEKLGPKINARLVRHGFYPAGGGEFHVDIEPVGKLGSLSLLQRGYTASLSAKILLSKLPDHVAERERNTLTMKSTLKRDDVTIENVGNSAGPGNIVLLSIESEHVTEMFCGFGEIGVRAETVAEHTIETYRNYVKHDVPVGEHLADQLLLPLGIAAWQGAGPSEFLTLPLSRHSTTHIEILKRFLEIDIRTEIVEKGRVLVRIGGSP